MSMPEDFYIKYYNDAYGLEEGYELSHFAAENVFSMLAKSN